MGIVAYYITRLAPGVVRVGHWFIEVLELDVLDLSYEHG